MKRSKTLIFTLTLLVLALMVFSCSKKTTEPEIQTVATPAFNPPAGTYTSVQHVTITSATSGAIIRYTTNGTEPTESSPQYTAPILVNASVTLKAKAFRNGWNPSPVASSSYNVSLMVGIAGGPYTMGDIRGVGYYWEHPSHPVTVNSFYISKSLVTQSEYQAIMGINPASGYGVGANHPVYNVSWYSAIKYSNLRSMAEGLTPVYSIAGSTNPADWGVVPYAENATWDAVISNWNANGYRLPTEAEWELAARGGSNTPDYLYSGSDDIDAVAWYWGNNTPQGTKPVATKAPNSLGLYDMSGNILEWSWDWYDSAYYDTSPTDNPKGPDSGTHRSLRGGGWDYDAIDCRVSSRDFAKQWEISTGIGFRVVRSGL